MIVLSGEPHATHEMYQPLPDLIEFRGPSEKMSWSVDRWVGRSVGRSVGRYVGRPDPVNNP